MIFDRFPITKPANESVDKVRKSEDLALRASGDPTLKGSKYPALYRGVPTGEASGPVCRAPGASP